MEQKKIQPPLKIRELKFKNDDFDFSPPSKVIRIPDFTYEVPDVNASR